MERSQYTDRGRSGRNGGGGGTERDAGRGKCEEESIREKGGDRGGEGRREERKRVGERERWGEEAKRVKGGGIIGGEGGGRE